MIFAHFTTMMWVVLVAVSVIWLYCYSEFRHALHRQNILDYRFEGAEYNVSIFKLWKKLDPKCKNPITFFGAFGLPMMLMCVVALVAYGYYHLTISPTAGHIVVSM